MDLMSKPSQHISPEVPELPSAPPPDFHPSLPASSSSQCPSSSEISSDLLVNSSGTASSHRSTLLYARLCVKYPWWLLLLWTVIPLIALVIIILSDSFVFADQSTRGYLIPSDPIVQQAFSIDAAQNECFGKEANVMQERTVNRGGDWAVFFMFRDVHLTSSQDDSGGMNGGYGLLDVDKLKWIRQVEQKFSEDVVHRFGEFCWLDQSFLNCQGQVPNCALGNTVAASNFTFGIYNVQELNRQYTVEICDLAPFNKSISEHDHQRFIQSLVQDNQQINPDYAPFLGKDFTETFNSTAYLRSYFNIGSPFKGHSSSSDNSNAQAKSFEKWIVGIYNWAKTLSTDQIEVLVYNVKFYNYMFTERSTQSFIWAIGSIIFVFVCIVLHTRSIFIASWSMIQIVLAFPLTYFLYYVCFRVTYFSTIDMLSIFLLLGIAADDIFVFIDAFYQSRVVLGKKSSTLHRLDWTFKRAAKAMLTTSVTTAAAFFITATSPIMPISTFGIWSGILILIQYLWCLLMFPCALVIWNRYWRERHWRYCLKKAPVDKKLDQLDIDTPENSATGDAHANQLNKKGWKPFWKKSSSTSPEQQEIPYTEEILPQTLANNIMEDPADLDLPPNDDSTLEEPETCIKTQDLDNPRDRREQEMIVDYRAVERFFRGPWNTYVFKMRFVHTIIGAAVLGVCIWLATRLEPLQDEEQWFPEDDPMMKAANWMNDHFLVSGQESSFLDVDVAYGIASIDRSSVDKYDPDDIGTVIWDPEFSLLTKENQIAIRDTCDIIWSNEKLVLPESSTVPHRCWMKDFEYYQTYQKPGTPGLVDYPSVEALSADVWEFLNFVTVENSRPYAGYYDREQIGFIEKESGEKILQFFYLRFKTPHKASLPYSKMIIVYNDWQAAIAEINQVNPKGVNQAFPSGGDSWSFMVTQNTLVSNCFSGVGLAIAISFVAIALSTLNIVVAFWATICVGSIVVTVLGAIYLYGWTLGIIETVAAVIIVGFSIDYIVHLSNSYVESKRKGKCDRMQDALTDMGISILFGALTTAGAGAFLFGPKLIFFPKFGALLMTTVGLSLVWSLIFFSSLMHIVGPSGNFGDMKPYFKKVFHWMSSCLIKIQAKLFACCTRKENKMDEIGQP